MGGARWCGMREGASPRMATLALPMTVANIVGLAVTMAVTLAVVTIVTDIAPDTRTIA